MFRWLSDWLMTCRNTVFAFVLAIFLTPALVISGLQGPVVSAMAAPPLEVMAGSMILVGFRGQTPADLSADLLEDVRAGRLGGVILFDREYSTGESRNIVSPEQVQTLVDALQEAAGQGPLGTLLVGVDQEGGKVCRLKEKYGFASVPSAEEMGTWPTERIREIGRMTGREMAAVGINVDFAPVLDVRVHGGDGTGLGDRGRIFSRDPKRVAECGPAFADGLRDAGVVPVFKHFPGLGSAGKNTHFSLPDVTDSWSGIELLPFREAFAQKESFGDDRTGGTGAGIGAVMAAHVFNRNLDPDLPSSLSPRVIDGLLRTEMGWDGVVISDDLQMRAVNDGRGMEELVRLAILAGNDILLFGNNLEYRENLQRDVLRAVLDLVQRGEIDPERIERSWQRIERLRTALKKGARSGNVPD